MLIPESCYGPYQTVRSRQRRLATTIGRGASLADALNAGNTLDTDTTSGLVLLHGPSPLVGGDAAFQMYLPHFIIRKSLLRDELSDEIADRIFVESLNAAWSVLGLLSKPNLGWLSRTEDCVRAVAAARSFWTLLDGVGARYSTGLPAGQRLWDVRGNLPRLLVCSGIDPTLMNSPAPPAGFPGLLDQPRS
jgi:hypothetical protein